MLYCLDTRCFCSVANRGGGTTTTSSIEEQLQHAYLQSNQYVKILSMK